MADYSYQGNQPLFFDMRWQFADGTLVGYEYFGDQGVPYDQDTGQPIYPEFQLVVPGTQYRWVEAREAAALVGGAIIAIIFGWIRRPASAAGNRRAGIAQPPPVRLRRSPSRRGWSRRRGCRPSPRRTGTPCRPR